MLNLEHIMKLRLDRSRIQAHTSMPPPAYSHKELTARMAAIGDATIATILDVTPDNFAAQLEAAREFGVSYVVEDRNHGLIGVSAATSVIRSDGDILQKNMILPYSVTSKDPRLKTHCILGVFLRSAGTRDRMPCESEVEIAGWTDLWGIRQNKLSYAELPPTFKSKLRVVMVPCRSLNPISTFMERVNADSLCV